MFFLAKLSKKYLASENLWKQVFGALIQWRLKPMLVLFFLVAPTTIIISNIIAPGDWIKCILFVCINLLLWLTIKTCHILTDVFSLRKSASNITWCYITILSVIGLWIVSFLLVYDIKNNGRVAAAIGAVGVIVSIILQDKIKGVMAFLHLRMHHLLNIGDWLKVDKLGVDGEVQRMTLTSVTIYNWDTTTSTIPISALQTDHFINLQNMMDGKTHGRRMLKSFIIDTSSFRVLSIEEMRELKESHKEHPFFTINEDAMNDGVLNAHLYRMYIYHWLMQNEHVSQYPRLIVRWMDQTEGGMPLQVYAFIIDSGLPSFEWQQSLIIEHIISSLDMFGLRLYQKPSGNDMRNRKGGEQ